MINRERHRDVIQINDCFLHNDTLAVESKLDSRANTAKSILPLLKCRKIMAAF